jgi:hypothetical protein
MPLIINVGLSRKASENYQSSGVSINVTAELDQSLLARPGELQMQVDRLYEQAQDAVDRQIQRLEQAAKAQIPAAAGPVAAAPGNGARASGNGRPVTGASPAANGKNGNGNGPVVPMTPSQERAIQAIGRKLGMDVVVECRDVFGWDVSKLNIRQASEYIDQLKAFPAAAAATG